MRDNLRLISVGLALLIVAGCSDSSMNPSAPTQRAFSAQGPAFDYYSTGSLFGDQSTTFYVPTSGGTFSVGGGLFGVTFPAGAICDPATTVYASTDCNLATGSVKVTATVRLTSLGLGVDFQPAMRFATDKPVILYTDIFAPIIRANSDFFAKYPSTLRPLALYYAPNLGADRVADYMTDPSVVTHINLNTGRIWRRVKHFSGYSQTSGLPCDPSPDDLDCIQVDGREQ